MLDRIKAESSWLGAEALPAGLTEINETIEAWAVASTPPAAPSASGLPAGRVDFRRCALGEESDPAKLEVSQIAIPFRQSAYTISSGNDKVRADDQG